MLENYYKTLGIPADADETTLKKAFRRLALRLHPDVNTAPDSNLRFQQLCEAYEVLLRHIKYQTTLHTDRKYETEENNYSYEDVIREAREAARKRARMKYEKMKAEKELFEKSGLRDLVLLFNYIGRIIAIPLVIVLIGLPVWVALTSDASMFFALLFFWIIGGFLLLQMISFRKTWFRQGKFRWKIKDLYKLVDFSPVTDNPTADCYYCKSKKADSSPLNLTFHKIRHVILQNRGSYKHSAEYKRKIMDVVIPRSAKARKVHFVQSCVKISCMLLSLVFVPFPDFIWRFCFGLFLGIVLSSLLLWITGTRSKVSHLLNYFLLIKISIWMIAIISQSILYPGFILDSTENTLFYLLFLAIFGDLIIDLVCKIFPFYKNLYQPVFDQGPVIDRLSREGYQNYMDIPVWSTVYPMLVWFF
jgi:hypothetical protein